MNIFSGINGGRRPEVLEFLKIQGWFRHMELEERGRNHAGGSRRTPGATVVGVIYRYPTVVPKIRQARVAHGGGGGI